MLSEFLLYFKEHDIEKYSDDLYNDFIFQLGGKSFGNGLLGYDWLGRCFGIDLRERTQGKILMFEIGTNDVLQIPCSFQEFLNEEIPLHSDACLAEPFFNEWMKYSKESITYGRCVGYKIPLFLGGEDTIANLENSDMEVYWGIITQIKNKRAEAESE